MLRLPPQCRPDQPACRTREDLVWLPRAVVNHLRALRAPDETFSDVILRLVARGSLHGDHAAGREPAPALGQRPGSGFGRRPGFICSASKCPVFERHGREPEANRLDQKRSPSACGHAEARRRTGPGGQRRQAPWRGTLFRFWLLRPGSDSCKPRRAPSENKD
jgi:hypothetical protein